MQSSLRHCFRANSPYRTPQSCCHFLPRSRCHHPSREKWTDGRSCCPTETIVEVLLFQERILCEQDGSECLDPACQDCRLCTARELSGKRNVNTELVCRTSDVNWHCDATERWQLSPFAFDGDTLRRSSWGLIKIRNKFRNRRKWIG